MPTMDANLGMCNISSQHRTKKAGHRSKRVGQTHQQARISRCYVQMIDRITRCIYTGKADTKNKK